MRFKISKILLIGLMAGVIAGSQVPAHGQSVDDLANRFDHAFCGATKCDPSAEVSKLVASLRTRQLAAWSVERRIRALANMFEVTRDRRYLRFGKALISVLYGLDARGNRSREYAFRDDLSDPPIVDAVRRRIMRGWSTTSYGVPYVALVHSGVLMSASARFANLLLADTALAEQHPWARAVLADSGHALTQFTQGNELASVDDRGYTKKMYLAPQGMALVDCDRASEHFRRSCELEKAFAGRELPFNQSISMGQLALELFASDPDNQSLAALIIGLANHFLLDANLKRRADGALQWTYWSAPQSDRLASAGPVSVKRRFDDASHGNIIVSFFDRFAPLAQKVMRAAGPTMRLAAPIDDAFFNALSLSVFIKQSGNKVIVDASIGDIPRSQTMNESNARLLQAWCLLPSRRMRAGCVTAASQSNDPVVLSYLALATSRKVARPDHLDVLPDTWKSRLQVK